MKVLYFSFFIFFIFHSCDRKGNEINLSNKTKTDSLEFYMKTANKVNAKDSVILKSLERAYFFATNLENSQTNRDTIFSISYKQYLLKDWKSFNEVANNLLKKSKEVGDSINLVKAYRFKANYFKRIEEYDSSFYYYIKAEKIYFQQNDQLNLANILFNKGIVQYSKSDYLGAESSLVKAYYIFKNSNEIEKYYGTLNQLGLVCNELKEYERAEDYHKIALKLVKDNKLSGEHQETVCYNNLGYLFLKQKKYNEAIKNFEAALIDKNVLKDDPELYSTLKDNLAYSRLQMNNFDDLPNLFFEALEVRKELNNYTIIVGSYIHLSEYYSKIKNKELAISYSSKALKIAELSKIPFNIILSSKQASIVDSINSSKHYENYIRISDSLQVAERNSKDRFARIELETDELKKKNLVLEERNRDVLNFLFGTILFVGFLYYMRVQRSKERELALKQAHQKANEEIYRLIISHQNQLEEGRDLEKKRLSKELHDGVLGRLFGLRLNLDGLNSFDDEDAKQQRLEYLNELQIIEQDLREISHELSRENLVLINNFVAILNRLVEEQAKVNTAKIKMIIADDIQWDKVSNIIKINLYRILQEALQNINKHAKAKNISIHFRTDKKGNLLFDIEDDGIGYDTTDKKKKGIGTKNIVERTQQCNGFIDIKSEVGVGSKIIITFPVDSKTIKI